jgi:hypothetical protein
VTRRLGITIVLVALCVTGVAAAAQAAETFGLHTPVAVTPARGTPTTTFTVRFATPLATRSSGGLRSSEMVSVADRGQSDPSCTSVAVKRLPASGAHVHVSARLSAGAKRWCAGTYAGTVTLYRWIVCAPGPAPPRAACPDIAFAPEPIGHFRFSVARAAS